jgi:hypothetical protein
MAEQLRASELSRNLGEGRAKQGRLQETCMGAEAQLASLQAERDELLSRFQAMDGRIDRSVQDAEARLADVQVS